MKTVYNPTDEVFTWDYDREPYTIPAKGTLETTDFVADHLAKHLANKILHEMDDPNPKVANNPDGSRPKIANVYTHPLREKVLETIYGAGGKVYDEDVHTETPPKRKGGRPRKNPIPEPVKVAEAPL